MNLGLCDGVTTNPSLMAKSNVKDIHELIKKICNYKNVQDVSVELLDPFKPQDELVEEANSYFECNQHKVVIKVPMIDIRTHKLIEALGEHGIPVNLTCLMSAYQTIIGAQSFPLYISLFYRRMVDYDGYEYARYQIETSTKYLSEIDGARPLIICGSIRDPYDVQICFDAGADIVTVPYKLLMSMYEHPKTKEAVKEFTDKWKANC